MSDKLIILASCEGVTPLKDKGWSIRFHTQEPSKGQIDLMLEAYTKFGPLVFVPGKESLTDEEIKEIDEIDVDIYDKPKTQSQRLRNVLYKLWQQEGDDMIEFKEYYKMKTEKRKTRTLTKIKTITMKTDIEFYCPQCGLDTPELHEGYCKTCLEQRQYELSEHNFQYDRWGKMTYEERNKELINP